MTTVAAGELLATRDLGAYYGNRQAVADKGDTVSARATA